jgi:hypothetical protein
MCNKKPLRRGTVDIAPASGTRRTGFESRQVIRFLGNIAVLLCKMERRNKGLAARYICKKEALLVSETPLDDVTFQSRPLQTLDKYVNDRYVNLSAKEQLMLSTQQRYVGRPIFRL